jgi:hypothetical protein
MITPVSARGAPVALSDRYMNSNGRPARSITAAMCRSGADRIAAPTG